MIPKFMGWQEFANPVAELWFGAHSSGSSFVTDSDVTLHSRIAEQPGEYLGNDVIQVFGARLPFMLKLIAIERPLSIQVHPNQMQVQKNDKASAHLYADECAKPEQLIALSKMEVLHGFRHSNQLRELLSAYTCPRIQSALKQNSVAEVFMELLHEGYHEEIQTILGSLGDTKVDTWIRTLSSLYPTDPSVLAPYFLNFIELEVGDSISIDPGDVHAYLSGFGLEVLGNSDNVLRAGLTDKEKNLNEFEKIVNPNSISPTLVTPELQEILWWQSKHPEFRLGKYDQSCSSAPLTGPAIVICLEGNLQTHSGNSDNSFSKGEAFFVKGNARVTFSGDASAYVCTPNLREKKL